MAVFSPCPLNMLSIYLLQEWEENAKLSLSESNSFQDWLQDKDSWSRTQEMNSRLACAALPKVVQNMTAESLCSQGRAYAKSRVTQKTLL